MRFSEIEDFKEILLSIYTYFKKVKIFYKLYYNIK